MNGDSRGIGAIIIGDEITLGRRQDKHFAKIVELLAARDQVEGGPRRRERDGVVFRRVEAFDGGRAAELAPRLPAGSQCRQRLVPPSSGRHRR